MHTSKANVTHCHTRSQKGEGRVSDILAAPAKWLSTIRSTAGDNAIKMWNNDDDGSTAADVDENGVNGRPLDKSKVHLLYERS